MRLWHFSSSVFFKCACALSLYPFVASFKEISLKSDLMHVFFTILYMYMAPGQGADNPLGTKF